MVKPGRFERLMKKENTVLFDVRTPQEYNAGHIPGAINLDVKSADFSEQVAKLDNTKRYLLYCRSGKRSAAALQVFRAKGFTQTRHLKGGIEAWERSRK